MIEPIPNSIIERISYKERDYFEADGQLKKYYEVYSYLQPQHQLSSQPEHTLYGHCDGTGSHPELIQAMYRSISESLERWAFYQIIKSPQNKNYHHFGFNQDCSTNGMAAYPRPFKKLARQNAIAEMHERVTLDLWWNHGLPTNMIPLHHDCFQAIKIQCPQINLNHKPYFLVITYKNTPDGQRAYGFAANKCQKKALQFSLKEMSRNYFLLLNNNGTPLKVTSLTEKRLLYFASSAGQQQFDEHRIKYSQQKDFNTSLSQTNDFKIIVDQEMVGSWTKYAHVWRTLSNYSMNTSQNTDIFLF
jgi:hypothetical protein